MKIWHAEGQRLQKSNDISINSLYFLMKNKEDEVE
jgi:hypothetical protein